MLKSLSTYTVSTMGVALILLTCYLADKFITHKYIESNAAMAVTLTDLGYKPVLVHHRCLVPVEDFWMACNDAIAYNRLRVVIK